MKTLRTVLLALLALVSLANAAQALRQYYHMPLLEQDDMGHRDAAFVHTREVLSKLGTFHIGYVLGPAAKNEYGRQRFENQFLLAPLILKSNSPEGPFVLVNFGAKSPTVPMPGLTLVEDFHNGFALFRKAP